MQYTIVQEPRPANSTATVAGVVEYMLTHVGFRYNLA